MNLLKTSYLSKNKLYSGHPKETFVFTGVHDQVIQDMFMFMLPTVRGGGVWREAQSVLKPISGL